MKRLDEILDKVSFTSNSEVSEIRVSAIEIDSRKCKSQGLFVAYKGYVLDGHDFIEKAIANGANVIVYDDDTRSFDIEGIHFVLVENARAIVPIIAANFYDHPSRKLRVVGVTGTNGKTTTSDLLYKLYTKLGRSSGLISTVKTIYASKELDANLTTPDPVKLQALFYNMKQAGVTDVFMEVSSHSIDQGRVDQVDFDHLIFTNLTHDHLDYHKTFKAYLETKKLIFDRLPKNKTALTNIDDTNGKVMVQNCEAKVYSYALKRPSDFKGKIISNSIEGLQVEINNVPIFLRLIGEFNAYNALAVLGTAMIDGFELLEVATHLSDLLPAEGRLDLVRGSLKEVIAVVDYAHTPDALDNILRTLQGSVKGEARLITVVGCGGDRDKLKRPKMARIAQSQSDLTILTSDNPRSEEPESILKDMEAGLIVDSKEYITIVDRKQAIKTACLLAKPGDVILVAGKGHEKYQEIKGEKFPFDDKAFVREFLIG